MVGMLNNMISIQYEFLLLVLPVVLWFITWIAYLATMSLVRAKDALMPSIFRLGMGVFYVSLVLSTTLNWLVFTFLLLELPREFTLSARLSRHLKAGGWRGRQAGLIGARWLDPFDPSGKHI